jgi:hypothetical protein
MARSISNGIAYVDRAHFHPERWDPADPHRRLGFFGSMPHLTARIHQIYLQSPPSLGTQFG